jgi:hypothetical protein
VSAKYVQVLAPGVIFVKAHAPVALNTAIHLVVYEWTQVLVTVSAFPESITPVTVPGHDCHILEMAFTAFIADWAVMGMINHQPFNHLCPKHDRFGVIDRNTRAIRGRGHASHDELPLLIVFIPELFDRALATGSY